jgi:molecular chaperone DnaK (HSP70)
MYLQERQNDNKQEVSMSNVVLPVKCEKPLRVLGIDLGTTNSVMTEVKWQPGSTPETKVIQIEQDTPLGIQTYP